MPASNNLRSLNTSEVPQPLWTSISISVKWRTKLFTSEKDCEDKMKEHHSRKWPRERAGTSGNCPGVKSDESTESACSPLEKQVFY